MTPSPSLAATAASSARWSFIAAGGRRAITLLTTLVLARLLSPDDFGLVAMAAIFINFVDVIRDLGTGKAIIQIEAADEDLLSSLFWMNVALGAILATLLFGLAPVTAVLLREPRVGPVLAALSVTTMLVACGVVQASLLARQMRFRQLAMAELAGAAVGGGVGIVLALRGHGVWSLVWQTIITTGLMSGGTWIASDWRPRRRFSRGAVRPALAFGANVTGFNVFNHFARNADNFLIGRYLGAQNLGVYDLAYRLMLYPLQLFSWAAGRVMFPVYARMQTDRPRLAAAYLRSVRVIALISFPTTLGIAAIADLLVPTLMGPAWSPSVAVLVILAPVGALQTLGTTVGSIYQAVGRTDLMLKWGAISGTIFVMAFIIGLPWGVVGVAGSYAVASFALSYPLFRIPLKLIDLSVTDLAKAAGPALVCSSAMMLLVLLLKAPVANAVGGPTALGILVTIGAAVYASATWRFNRQCARDVIALVRGSQ